MEKKVNSVIIDNDGLVYCRGAVCPVCRWYDNSCEGCPVDKLFLNSVYYGIEVHTAINKKRKEQENGKAESN